MTRARWLGSVLLLALAACDPCGGTASCRSGEARLSIDGQIVRVLDGRGIDGIHIDVIRVGGATTKVDSMSTVTRSGGFWHVETPTTSPGDVTVDVRVASPSLAHPYSVRLQVPPVTRAGEAYIVDRWVTDLYYPYYVELFRRDLPSQVWRNVDATFTQTSGPPLRGVAEGGVLRTSTDFYGRAQVFLYNAFASDTGEVVGTLTVNLPAGPSKTGPIHLKPTHFYRAPGIVPRLGAGPSLGYSAAIFDRATGRVLPGVRVDFSRIGGVETDPNDFSTTTDKDGYAHLNVIPLGFGNVIAIITIHPPIGAPETFQDTIPTFDSDVPRLLANWNAGAVLPYYGIVRAFGRAVPGVKVHVRRAGGIGLSPDDNVVETDADGVFQLSPHPLQGGSAQLELTFTPPSPFRAFIAKNIVISTVQRETSGFNVWVWDLEKGLTGPPGSDVSFVP